MAEQKVATEVAEQEFDRFVEAMDLDVDPAGMDDDDKASFKVAKRRIITGIERGQIVVDEKGQPVFTPSMGNTSAIVFYEPRGASLMASDQKKKGHDVAKMLATLADMTKQPPARFSDMVNRDLKIVLALGNLFLGG